jgi:hypothetical protein
MELTFHSPVYEYPLNGQWIMMDIDDGYILWTGIWKGANSAIFWSLAVAQYFPNSPRELERWTKSHVDRCDLTSLIADIVKMLDSQPDLAPLIRRVRGGYLKIQGTWMPYEVNTLLSCKKRP